MFANKYAMSRESHQECKDADQEKLSAQAIRVSLGSLLICFEKANLELWRAIQRQMHGSPYVVGKQCDGIMCHEGNVPCNQVLYIKMQALVIDNMQVEGKKVVDTALKSCYGVS